MNFLFNIKNKIIDKHNRYKFLIPREGFSGDTSSPSEYNNNSSIQGYDEKAIARWDVVPYQTFSGLFEVGVVAFHISGIDKVEFSVEGGPWISVKEMRRNPRTRVIEYFTILNAADFEDGLVEVRAIVYPNVGIPRVLSGEYDVTRSYKGSHWTGEHSLFLYSKSNNSIISEIVELEAGNYTWGESPVFYDKQDDKTKWYIFKPAPVVNPNEVIINSNSENAPPTVYRDFLKIKLENLTITGSSGRINYFSDVEDMLWLDKVKIIGDGQHEEGSSAKAGHQWWTDCIITDSRYGQATQFIRNCIFKRIGEDVMREAHTVLNVNVIDVDSGFTGWHAGVIANPIVHDNRIYYNMHSTVGSALVWPLRNGTHNYWENHDIAIIDCYTETSSRPQTVYIGAETKNLYIKNSSFIGGTFAWRVTDDIEDIPEYWQFVATNVVLENVIIEPDGVPNPQTVEGVTII